MSAVWKVCSRADQRAFRRAGWTDSARAALKATKKVGPRAGPTVVSMVAAKAGETGPQKVLREAVLRAGRTVEALAARWGKNWAEKKAGAKAYPRAV